MENIVSKSGVQNSMRIVEMNPRTPVATVLLKIPRGATTLRMWPDEGLDSLRVTKCLPRVLGLFGNVARGIKAGDRERSEKAILLVESAGGQ
jgi:hypothetical protein